MSAQAALRKQICLFGTSANPPTGESGHVGIVRALSSLGKFDEIRVLPVYRHMFSKKRNELAPFLHRMEMCKLAFEDIPNATVLDSEYQVFRQATEGMTEEQKLTVTCGTANLLDMLVLQEPNSDFTFCLGADAFLDLVNLKWKRSKDIIELVGGRLLVLFRKTHENGNQASHTQLNAHIEQINSSFRKNNSTEHEQNQNRPAELLNISTLDFVSSTVVRNSPPDDILSLNNGYVLPKVLSYMRKHELYSFGKLNGS